VPKRKPDDRVTGADIIAFIEEICFVPEGAHVGKKLKLLDWQKTEIRKIYDNPVGTRRAIISMPRKNAKSTLSACLLLAHLCGPPARNKPNSQLYSAAQSRDQAGIVFSLASKMVRNNPRDCEVAHVPRAWHKISRAFCREHYCFRTIASIHNLRRAGPSAWPAVAVIRSAGDRDRRAGQSAHGDHFNSGADGWRSVVDPHR